MRSAEEVTERRVGVMLERMRRPVRMQAEMRMGPARCSAVSEIGRVFRVEIRIESADDAGAVVHSGTHRESSQLARRSEIRPQTHGSQLLQPALLGALVLEPHLSKQFDIDIISVISVGIGTL